MSQLLSLAIFLLFFYTIGKFIMKKFHLGSHKQKRNHKKSNGKSFNKKKNKKAKQSLTTMIVDKYFDHKDNNQLDQLPDGRLILSSEEPGVLPPLPRHPIVGRAAKPAIKKNRRLSPWGGTMDLDEDYDGE